MAFNTPRNIGPTDQLLFNAAGECVGIQPGGSSSPALFGLNAQDKAATQAMVSGAGISAPSALFANLPAAEDNAGNVIRVTDIGKGGTLWMPSGDIWVPVNGRAQLLRTPVPFILSSSGSIGNNGALTLTTALDRIYPRSFMYFPAGAIFAGSSAGWFWTVMSSTTAGVIYNNIYTSGYPVIPTIAGFSTTGPGAFSQTAGVDLNCLSVTLPGGCLGRYGGLQTRLCMTSSASASGTKTGKVFAGASQFHVTTMTATNTFANGVGGFSMDGNPGVLKITHAEQTAGFANGIVYAQAVLNNDLTVDRTVAISLKTSFAADWVALQEAEIEVLGG